ncbi:Zn-dependent protease [Ruminiclostridium sufflavum DSM 19573]|uniref:Zn-dependent protease n=1 Tax=Ruminiclostridium sufflavum DSM 19573 TaxID=1121337 RepID=A0A318XNK4_9FIRM|nr:site-2 protease family protein [Ruminiclostridium sufflavum]PYG87592.1 Zn-dependent protease [Ruminiclostridium sufflavum DSM 19573]
MFSNMFTQEAMIYNLMILPGILLGFVLHEYAHALTADRLGDSTPRSMGRITLDPRAHIDIIGFILILIVGFGWAKPVMTNPRNYKNLRRDSILVSLAGPLTNFLLAIVFILLLKIFMFTGAFSSNEQLQINITRMLFYSGRINILLFVLNLLPIPALDGYHVLTSLFNTWKYRIFSILEQYGMFIFMLLAFTNILGRIINPITQNIYDLLIKLIL